MLLYRLAMQLISDTSYLAEIEECLAYKLLGILINAFVLF